MYKQIYTPDGKKLDNAVLLLPNSYIPFDPANRDYQEYLEWLAEGNTPLPPDEPTLSKQI